MLGYFIYELKKGNKVWIKIWYIVVIYMYVDKYLYFLGYKINFS